jgi:hypothetical protein
MDSQDANKKNILQLKAHKIYHENSDFFNEKLKNSAQISSYHKLGMIEMGQAVRNSLKSNSFERNFEWLSQIQGKLNLDILICKLGSGDLGIEQ